MTFTSESSRMNPAAALRPTKTKRPLLTDLRGGEGLDGRRHGPRRGRRGRCVGGGPRGQQMPQQRRRLGGGLFRRWRRGRGARSPFSAPQAGRCGQPRWSTTASRRPPATGKPKPGGITPTTRVATPLTVTTSPSAAGLAAKTSSQVRCEEHDDRLGPGHGIGRDQGAPRIGAGMRATVKSTGSAMVVVTTPRCHAASRSSLPACLVAAQVAQRTEGCSQGRQVGGVDSGRRRPSSNWLSRTIRLPSSSGSGRIMVVCRNSRKRPRRGRDRRRGPGWSAP